MPTTRSTVRRGAKRACYDKAAIKAILDAAFLCHIAFVLEGKARLIPTAYVRLGDALYIHGSQGNGMMNALLDGQTACVSVTLIDGLVLARSAFHHSVNYRSVVIYTRAEEVAEEDKHAPLDALIEHFVPGRSASLRPSHDKELRATRVLKLPILDASAKIRAEGPIDAEEDYALPSWAGVLNLRTRVESVTACPRLDPAISLPEHVSVLLKAEDYPPAGRSGSILASESML